MGSPADEPKRGGHETQHKVTLTKGFYMGIYTVTQEQWQAVMGNTLSSGFEGEKNLPVDRASWNDCQNFLRELRKKDNKPFRLPTEAEWEYACRAGTTTPFNTGETISTDQANYSGNYVYGSGKKGLSRNRTMPVGSFPPNALGLYDMHGNVGQWCQDWYFQYPIGDATDPQGPQGQPDVKYPTRVWRGNSFNNQPHWCRSAARYSSTPDDRQAMSSFHCGFRVVFSLP